MSCETREKTLARALQEDTDWSYSECLRCVRTLTEDEIDALILQREKAATR